MYSYFAQIGPDGEGGYAVMFPDLDYAVTSGETLEEAAFMAEDLLRSWIESAQAEGDAIPKASPLEEAKRLAKARSLEVGLPVSGETFYHLVRTPANEKPVRCNISLLPSVPNLIDEAARREGLTRSGFITVASRQYAMKTARS